MKAADCCPIAAVTRQKACQKPSIQFGRMLIVYRDLGGAERLYQTSNQSEDATFLFLVEKRSEFGSQELVTQISKSID